MAIAAVLQMAATHASKFHYLGYSSARVSGNVFEVRNGPNAGDAVLTLDYTGALAVDAGVTATTGTFSGALSATVLTASTAVRAANGTVGAPGLSFTNETDCGIYVIGTNNLGASVAGAKVLDIATTGLGVTGVLTVSSTTTLSGSLLFSADATHDIGASGATRPRDFFMSRNATIGGTLGVTGAATLSSTLAVTSLATLTAGFKTTSGNCYIGDDANANMTLGLTINQAGNDDEILAFKSSDVAHGITTLAETDTFGRVVKTSSTVGGLRFDSYSASTNGDSMELVATTTTINTTHTAAGRAIVTVDGRVKSGTTNAAAGANANLFAVSTAGSLKFIVDAEGDLFADAGGGAVTGGTGTEATVYDEHDDVALVRAYDIARAQSGARGLVENTWDRFVQYNEDDLVRLGILGAPLRERGLLNVTRLQKLHNGAIWQLHTRQSRTEEAFRYLLDNPNDRAGALRLLEAA